MQIPDELYRDAKRIARDHEMTLAEVIRRGLEHMVQIYPEQGTASGQWQPPAPRRLGAFRASEDAWRELANEM